MKTSGTFYFQGLDGKFTLQSNLAFWAGAFGELPGAIVLIQDNTSYHSSELPHAFYAAHADRQPDAITQAAGYRTIRIQSTSIPTGADIAEASREASQ